MNVRFPWNTIIALAIAFELLVFSVALFGDFKCGMDSALAGTVVAALLRAVGLAVLVMFIHATFKLVEAVFRLNRPKVRQPYDFPRENPFD